jgi:hypothetical protein
VRSSARLVRRRYHLAPRRIGRLAVLNVRAARPLSSSNKAQRNNFCIIRPLYALRGTKRPLHGTTKYETGHTTPHQKGKKTMATRIVTASRKDGDGDITALGAPGESWSPRSKNQVIDDIESGRHRYVIRGPGGTHTGVHVVQAPQGSYLRSDPDATERNNLDDLPDC